MLKESESKGVNGNGNSSNEVFTPTKAEIHKVSFIDFPLLAGSDSSSSNSNQSSLLRNDYPRVTMEELYIPSLRIAVNIDSVENTVNVLPEINQDRYNEIGRESVRYIELPRAIVTKLADIALYELKLTQIKNLAFKIVNRLDEIVEAHVTSSSFSSHNSLLTNDENHRLNIVIDKTVKRALSKIFEIDEIDNDEIDNNETITNNNSSNGKMVKVIVYNAPLYVNVHEYTMKNHPSNTLLEFYIPSLQIAINMDHQRKTLNILSNVSTIRYIPTNNCVMFGELEISEDASLVFYRIAFFESEIAKLKHSALEEVEEFLPPCIDEYPLIPGEHYFEPDGGNESDTNIIAQQQQEEEHNQSGHLGEGVARGSTDSIESLVN